MRSLNTFSPTQVPAYLIKDLPRADLNQDYPIFVEFLQKYYEFLESYTVDVERVRDVSATPEELLEFFRKEFAPGFDSKKVIIDERKFLELVRGVYRRKGSINAMELLFRLFFNDTIKVYEPYQQVLKTSDGKWMQEKSITVKKTYSAPESPRLEGAVTLTFSNDSGVFKIGADRYEYIDDETVRFFFRSYTRIFLEDGQLFTVFDGDRILFEGNAIKSPSKLRIISPGKYWKVGQVFIVPGTIENTVARVTKVSSTGEVLDTEIIIHGYQHNEGQSIIVSPFPNRPPTGSFALQSNIVGYNETDGFIYSYEAFINDGTENTLEGFVATSYDQQNKYFLQDYVELGYVGDILVQKFDEEGSSPGFGTFDPGLTFEKWLESRSTFVYEYETLVKYRGKYATDDGQLSNANIRLQDNYFYQLFSYVVQTTRSIEEYRDIISTIHPAGTKFFAEFSKVDLFDIETDVDVQVGDIEVNLDDATTGAFDSEPIKDAIKVVADAYEILEQIMSITINKGTLSDSVTVDGGEALSLDPNFYTAEDYFAEEYTSYGYVLTIG